MTFPSAQALFDQAEAWYTATSRPQTPQPSQPKTAQPTPAPASGAPSLRARSVEEAHLYMDLRGAEPGTRGHALVERGGRLISTYRCRCGQVDRSFEFEIPTPFAKNGLYGDDAPSTIIGPGEFAAHSEKLAKSVPRLDTLDEPHKGAARERLKAAIECLREVLKFIPPGQRRVPPEAFLSDEDRALFPASSYRYEGELIEVAIQSYQRALGG